VTKIWQMCSAEEISMAWGKPFWEAVSKGGNTRREIYKLTNHKGHFINSREIPLLTHSCVCYWVVQGDCELRTACMFTNCWSQLRLCRLGCWSSTVSETLTNDFVSLDGKYPHKEWNKIDKYAYIYYVK
jgi:hypothetical protein